MSYEEGSPTIPFSRDFTKAMKTIFLRDYVLSKERLLHILPYQMKLFSENEGTNLKALDVLEREHGRLALPIVLVPERRVKQSSGALFVESHENGFVRTLCEHRCTGQMLN